MILWNALGRLVWLILGGLLALSLHENIFLLDQSCYYQVWGGEESLQKGDCNIIADLCDKTNQVGSYDCHRAGPFDGDCICYVEPINPA